MPNLTIVGAQWGDEGKGKIADLLAQQVDLVVRFAGGSNAGHTLVVGDRKVVVHQLPSGVANPGKICVLGAGMVIDPKGLLEELQELANAGFNPSPDAVRLSSRAHLVLPYHRAIDALEDSQPQRIGTTRRGIGPAYEDKVARRGIRVGDLFRPERLRSRLSLSLHHANQRLTDLGGRPLDFESTLAELSDYAAKLAPYVEDTTQYLHGAMAKGKTILFEGAQGVLLDIDHGTYPFVTSSNTVAGGAATGTGVGPQHLGRIIGVAKAYVTRVGEGPFITELGTELGNRLRDKGGEFGATTGRPRRCGWLDLPALRVAVALSGIQEIALTKLDTLGGFGPLQICQAYRVDGRVYEFPPDDPDDWARAEPVLDQAPGFEMPPFMPDFDALPPGARSYIARIEKSVGVPITLVSIGPSRGETLFRIG